MAYTTENLWKFVFWHSNASMKILSKSIEKWLSYENFIFLLLKICVVNTNENLSKVLFWHLNASLKILSKSVEKWLGYDHMVMIILKFYSWKSVWHDKLKVCEKLCFDIQMHLWKFGQDLSRNDWVMTISIFYSWKSVWYTQMKVCP